MKKVDLSKPLLALGDTPKPILNEGKPVTMGSVLAEAICAVRGEKQPARMHTIAMAIYGAKGAVELEDADYDKIKKAVPESNLSTIVAGQIEKALDNVLNAKG